MKRSRLVVLAYHSINVGSGEYELNDHLALAEDLKIMTLMGWRIEPLAVVTEAWLAGRDIPPRTLAITLDDGADFDFHDLPHPTWGTQRSMLGIMGDFLDLYEGKRHAWAAEIQLGFHGIGKRCGRYRWFSRRWRLRAHPTFERLPHYSLTACWP